MTLPAIFGSFCGSSADDLGDRVAQLGLVDRLRQPLRAPLDLEVDLGDLLLGAITGGGELLLRLLHLLLVGAITSRISASSTVPVKPFAVRRSMTFVLIIRIRLAVFEVLGLDRRR